MKIFNHIFHLILIVFFVIAAFLYPVWLRDGYLDDLYPKVGVFVSIYGGLIGSIVWYVQNRKNI